MHNQNAFYRILLSFSVENTPSDKTAQPVFAHTHVSHLTPR